MLPAPADRVIPLQNQQSIRVGDIAIRAMDTPGHARHHHAYAIADHCFTGDVAGVRLTQSPYISVAAAPPQFDPPAYLKSIDRLLAEDFSTLHLTHFGTVSDVRQHLQRYRQRVQSLIQLADDPAARDLATAYCDWEQEEARNLGLPNAIWQRYEQINPTAMSAQGVQLWHQGKPPAKA
jgi:glyoxylase-like metal-dependent hydrolase (beta-lactamase superfamily II)